jgi:hypothetical protein
MNMKEACATFPHGSTVLVAAGQDDAVGRVVGYPWRRKWSPDNDPDMISVEFTLAEKWKLVKKRHLVLSKGTLQVDLPIDWVRPRPEC